MLIILIILLIINFVAIYNSKSTIIENINYKPERNILMEIKFLGMLCDMPDWRRPLGRPTNMMEDNIFMHFKEL
jgi:hypothetical protein